VRVIPNYFHDFPICETCISDSVMLRTLHIYIHIVAAVIWTHALHYERAHVAFEGAEEAWTYIPNVNVTFSYSFCCDEAKDMTNMLMSIEAMRFCFTDVFVTLDVPHGGHSMSSGELPGGPGGYSEFLNSSSGQNLVNSAHKTANAAVALLQSHCASILPMSRVDVLNYDEPAMRETLNSDFDLGWNPEFNDDFVFSKMYVNTMVYDKLLHLPGAQYVWHSDSDWRVYRVAEDTSLNFIERSIALMRSDERVVATVPTVTHFLEPRPWVVPGAVFDSTPEQRRDGMVVSGFIKREPGDWHSEEFDGKWPEGDSPTAPTTYKFLLHKSQFFSSQQFVMDTQKMRSLLPLHGTGTFESMIRPRLTEREWSQIFFDESTGVICGPGFRN